VGIHHQVTVTFSGDDNVDSLTPATALCLYRVAQEALSNDVRHARARTIGVQVMARDNTGARGLSSSHEIP
jgi:signal transduction histidine kinase